LLGCNPLFYSFEKHVKSCFDTEHMLTFRSTVSSITRQDMAAQVFSNGKGCVEFVPVQNKGRCHDALLSFINDVGISGHLVSDGAKEQGELGAYKTYLNEVQRKYNIYQTFIQPHLPRQNTAELDIGHLSRAISRQLAIRCSPQRLWAYFGLFCAGIRQLTVSTDPSAMGRMAFEQVHGYTPDIILYTRHDWYDMIWWFDSLDQTQKLGRWLGPCGRTFGAGD